MEDPREEVQDFAKIMEIRLQQNENKSHWTGCTLGHLLDKMKFNVEQLERALINGRDFKIINEAVDVANYAMMISDKINKGNK